jgi:hypothetical protein
MYHPGVAAGESVPESPGPAGRACRSALNVAHLKKKIRIDVFYHRFGNGIRVPGHTTFTKLLVKLTESESSSSRAAAAAVQTPP